MRSLIRCKSCSRWIMPPRIYCTVCIQKNVDELPRGQRATDQEIEDDLRDQIANGGC